MTKITISIDSINLTTTYKQIKDDSSTLKGIFENSIKFFYKISEEEPVYLIHRLKTLQKFYGNEFITGPDRIFRINQDIEKLLLKDVVFDILKKNKSHLEMLVYDKVTLVYKFTLNNCLYSGTDKTSNYAAEFLVTEGT